MQKGFDICEGSGCVVLVMKWGHWWQSWWWRHEGSVGVHSLSPPLSKKPNNPVRLTAARDGVGDDVQLEVWADRLLASPGLLRPEDDFNSLAPKTVSTCISSSLPNHCMPFYHWPLHINDIIYEPTALWPYCDWLEFRAACRTQLNNMSATYLLFQSARLPTPPLQYQSAVSNNTQDQVYKTIDQTDEHNKGMWITGFQFTQLQ